MNGRQCLVEQVVLLLTGVISRNHDYLRRLVQTANDHPDRQGRARHELMLCRSQRIAERAQKSRRSPTKPEPS